MPDNVRDPFIDPEIFARLTNLERQREELQRQREREDLLTSDLQNQFFRFISSSGGQWNLSSVEGTQAATNGNQMPENSQNNPCTTCESVTYCDCFTCSSCSRQRHGGNYVQCSSCEYCDSCCNCVSCQDCGSLNREYSCSNCQTCHNCDCTCEPENQGLRYIQARRVPFFHDGKVSKKNISSRYIACELEVANIETKGEQLSDAIDNWGGAIVHDGSIQGDIPFEINTAPASGDKFVEQMKEITQALSASKAEVNKSCGYHVHVDARDFKFIDLKKLILLYEKIEPALFKMVSASRSNNRYCAPCGPKYTKDITKEVSKYPTKILQNVYGDNLNYISETVKDKYNSARYGALNVHSLLYRGTIECRLHQGTVNFDKITNWALLWADILDFVVEHPEGYINKMSGDPVDMLVKVAHSDEIKVWIKERVEFFSNNKGKEE